MSKPINKNADSTNWATPFNGTGGGKWYDFTTFKVENSPFFTNGKNYYGPVGSTTPYARPTTYNNPNHSNVPPIRLATENSGILDPTSTKTSNTGRPIQDITKYKNGFTDSYFLGYAAGSNSKVNYVYITEQAFDLINKTDGISTKKDGAQVAIATLMRVQDIYANQGYKFTADSVYSDIDYQRGFFGVFCGYYQGYLDAVYMKTSGNPNYATLSQLGNMQTYFCNLASSYAKKGDTTSDAYKQAKQMCDTLSALIGTCNANINGKGCDTGNLNKMLTDANALQNTLSLGGGAEEGDYATMYLEMLSKLYKAVKAQNDTTLKKIQSNVNDFSADDQKVYYQVSQIQNLSYINIILLVVYYILFIFASYFIVFMDTHMDKRGKWLLVLFFLLYPFLINPICIFIYESFLYFYAVTNLNVYSPGTY